MKMNKRKLFVSALAICLIAILSMSTLAWFNATETVTNEFMFDDTDGDNIPDFKIDVIETGEDEDGGKQYEDILPGAELPKDPAVKNTGDYSMYTRLVVTLSDAATWITASSKYDLTGEKDDTYILEYMVEIDENWIRYDAPTRDVEGDTITYVYYYNGYVPAGATTATLFDKVTIPSKLQQADMNFGDDKFTIDVKGDAIQIDNIIPDDSILTQNNAYKSFYHANWTAGEAYPEA